MVGRMQDRRAEKKEMKRLARQGGYAPSLAIPPMPFSQLVFRSPCVDMCAISPNDPRTPPLRAQRGQVEGVFPGGRTEAVRRAEVQKLVRGPGGACQVRTCPDIFAMTRRNIPPPSPEKPPRRGPVLGCLGRGETLACRNSPPRRPLAQPVPAEPRQLDQRGARGRRVEGRHRQGLGVAPALGPPLGVRPLPDRAARRAPAPARRPAVARRVGPAGQRVPRLGVPRPFPPLGPVPARRRRRRRRLSPLRRRAGPPG